MAMFKRNATTASRARDMTRVAATQASARSKYLAHLAAAQGYRAAASTGGAVSQARDYVRRHPMASVGVIAGVTGLLGLGMYRRNKH
jgi:ElaB/YqjD/DUF883 family membrane-anchored ribosome-binding protein